MKELFPLKTFHQDAVLKRLSELYEISKDIVDGKEEMKIFDKIVDNEGLPVIAEWQMSNITFEPLGITIDAIYTKVVRNYNELQFIFNCRISNNTENNITINNDVPLCATADGAIPNIIKEKIYAHNGLKLTEVDSNQSIAFCSLFISATSGAVSTGNMPRYANLFYIKSQDSLRMYLSGGAISVSANGTYDLEARISLWL